MKSSILTLFFLLTFSSIASAQAIPPPDPRSPPRPQDVRIAQLQTRLNAINQAQQSMYQQFQMLQEMRRNEIAGTFPQVLPGGGLSNLPPISYDETVRLQRERQDRLQRYERDLDELYARYAELDEQKKAILDEIVELAKPEE
ncbi:MAG TPA: hypothetical protein VFI43_03025 [Nitrosospira sp.]|nr:hypothetical protein [Nitrosospira sp.]